MAKARVPGGLFASKLNDACGEAAETQVWLEFACSCGYLDADISKRLHQTYNEIQGTLIGMTAHPETWVIGAEKK